MLNIKNKLNNKGFSHFEMVLILILVAVISAAGIYVYNYNNNKSSAKAANSGGGGGPVCNGGPCLPAASNTCQRTNSPSCRNYKAPAPKPKQCSAGNCLAPQSQTCQRTNSPYCSNYKAPAPKKPSGSSGSSSGSSGGYSSGSSGGSYAGSGGGGGASSAPAPTNWSLSSKSNGSRDFAYAGSKVGFFHDIKNEGPATATYQYKVEQGLFNSKFEPKINWQVTRDTVKVTTAPGDHKPSLTRGDAHFLNTTGVIPSNANDGDQFCQRIVYTKHDGPSSSGAFKSDSNWKSGCVKVKNWYPHNYPTLTRALHNFTPKGPLYNYDVWWSDSTKKVLIVQMRVNIPANSPYTPANFRGEVMDGNRQLTYFRISQPVPSNWANSPKASYSQIGREKAPAGRYLGEAHINAADIKGQALTFHGFYLADKNKKTNNAVYNDTVKINKTKIVADDKAKATKHRGWPQFPISNSPNTILAFESDKATFTYNGCVNKTDKTKLDISVNATVPANFKHILRGYQANLKTPEGKSLVVLGLDKTKLPAGASADALDKINPQAGVYTGTTTIAKVPDLSLRLFYNTKDSNSAKGFMAGQTVLTKRFPVCQ